MIKSILCNLGTAACDEAVFRDLHTAGVGGGGAGGGRLALTAIAQATQCSAGMCHCSCGVVLSALPLGIAGRSVSPSVITLIRGTHKLLFSES